MGNMKNQNILAAIFRWRMNALPLILALSSISLRAYADQDIYTLAEVDDGQNVYFYNAADKAMIIDQCINVMSGPFSGTANITNVVVWAKKWGFNKDSVQSLVDTWQGPRGRAHSVPVLKRQLEFNDYFAKAFKKRSGKVYSSPLQIADCPDGASASDYSDDLWFDGLNHCTIITPNDITGVFGQSTLFIPYYHAVIRFTLNYDRFMYECRKASGHKCSGKPWPNAYFDVLANSLDAASAKINTLYAVLSAVPVIQETSDETPYETPVTTKENSYPGRGLSVLFPGGNFENLHVEFPGNSRCAITSDSAHDDYTYYPVDPAAIDETLLSQIHEAEDNANNALAQEEYATDGFFGPKNPQ
jgi:hypothetical protein